MNATEFTRWQQEALVGDRITYHTGYLARDIRRAAVDARASGSEEKKNHLARLSDIRSAAYAASVSGSVALFQKREGFMDYSYVAVRL